MNTKKYQYYSIEDFVLDGEFVAWCKGWSVADATLWRTVLELFPEQAENMLLAKDYLLHSGAREEEPTPEQMQRVWSRIENDLFGSGREEMAVAGKTGAVEAAVGMNGGKTAAVVRKMGWLRVAAAVILLAGASLIGYYVSTGQREITTRYAELKTVELPDHSRVTLNANSELRYARRWEAGKVREVWLSGEAYFDIVHLHQGSGPVQPGERFIVHAGGVDVEVLGTTFTVNDRHEAAKVTLISGRVELLFADKKTDRIVMKPGEQVQYTQASRSLHKQTASTLAAAAWKDHQWKFEKTSVREILQMLKDDYGLDASVDDPALWDRTISGTISSDNKEALINGLSVLLDIKIEQKDKTLHLH